MLTISSHKGNANQNHIKIPPHPPLWKKTWNLLKNVNIDLPYNPAIPFLGIYPKECGTGYFRCTCTPMFIATLFTIAKL
jgi:hypothetical protein